MAVKKRLMIVGAMAVAIGMSGRSGAQSGPGPVAPDAWVHEGDSDGDGLTDAFEIAHGLDPFKASSFADGTPDELRRDANGRTMWELQQAEKASGAATGDTGAGRCGATGLEVLFFLLAVRVCRRSVAMRGR